MGSCHMAVLRDGLVDAVADPCRLGCADGMG
jgi:hypothetical protein